MGDVNWIMCDGDKLIDVESFKSPSMHGKKTVDYAVRINETIYGSISDNLNNPIYTLNVQFLNESLNEQLHDKR